MPQTLFVSPNLFKFQKTPLAHRLHVPSHCPVRLCVQQSSPPTHPSTGNGQAPGFDTQKHSLPAYNIVRAPHLTDYISHLEIMPSPLLDKRPRKTFTNDNEVILSKISFDADDENLHNASFQAFLKAGPRKTVYFPAGVRAAIVSCGGICPGINSVIRELTLCLFQYKAAKVFGVRHGYRGFYQGNWIEITPEDVELLHKVGGSMLGSSRGGFDLIQIVDAIETRRIDQVYVIGGDGTIMGCTKIYHEIRRRGLKVSVVSVPKTIDNDIAIIDRSFGAFLTLNSM